MTRTPLTRTLLAAGLAAGTSLTAAVLYAKRGGDLPGLTTEPVSRGAIVRTISATGTLEARTTVQVGTQVSGTIQALHADFNAIVRKGQVLARLDPALFQSAIEQADASLERAKADLERLKVTLADAQAKRERARQLSERQLIAATELETAAVNADSAAAQVRAAAAQVTQAQAALRQAQVNLSKTVIASPIDGIVIARNVDVGQTVSASLQAPTLFVLGAELDRMQLKANVDESDLGAIREGQTVSFTVDAYPRDIFAGTVVQVRLNPVVEQNVVTYAAIISAANAELKLKPGMTANVTIEVSRRDAALRVPAAALRFRPTAEVKSAFGAKGVEATGTVVWTLEEGRIKPVAVSPGVSDGVYTEIAGAPLAEGAVVVTRASATPAAAATATQGSNPLMPSGPRPPR